MIYYWISEQKSFGRNIKYGDEVPNLDEERAKELIGKGLVSKKKPESITNSEKNKISEIEAVNKSLREEVSELKENSDKTDSVKLKEAKEKIKKLEEATAPGDK